MSPSATDEPPAPSVRPESRVPLGGLRAGLAVLLVATVAALFAIFFRTTLQVVVHAASGEDDVVEAARGLPLWAALLFPAGGALAGGCVSWLVARRGESQGVGDVMEAVVLGRVRLSMRTTLLKSLASWFAIASGGSLGREGPLVQFGGAIGKVIGQRLRVGHDQVRILVAAGTAAGFAAAYNTPFAAVLFVLEIVAGVVFVDAIVPTMVAAVVATALTRAAIGAGPVYGLRTFSLESPLELLAFAGLGIATALAAQGFMRLLSLGERAFRSIRLPLPWLPALGGLATGAVIAFVPEVAGNGYEPLQRLLDGAFPWQFVALLLVAKAVATTTTVSSGSPGGVFTPSLLIGGACGWLFAVAVAACGIDVGPPGGYALVGMAAATAATTHAPLMAAVMAFELSGDYAIVLPLVLATGVATAVSRRMRAESIYTAELAARGVQWRVTIDGRRVVAAPD